MKPRTKIRIRPPTVLFFALLILLDRSALSLIPIATALCHELGHLIVMRAVKMDVREVEITMFGAEIRAPAYSASELACAAVYAAGGAANILSAAIAWIIGAGGAYAEFFVACSFGLAFVNLLPVRSLDGGCILASLLACFAPQYAHSIVSAVSAVTLALLWLAAVYVLLVCGGNLSLMLFCIYLFVTLFCK